MTTIMRDVYTPPEVGRTPEEYRVWCRLMDAASTTVVVPVRGIRVPTKAAIDRVNQFAWDVHDKGEGLSYKDARDVLLDAYDCPPNRRLSLMEAVAAFDEAIPRRQHDWDGTMRTRRLQTIEWLRSQHVRPTPAQVTHFFCDLP